MIMTLTSFLRFGIWIISFAFFTMTTANALVVVISGAPDKQAPIEVYLKETFDGVIEVRIGNFADFHAPATQGALEGADLVIISRTVRSSDYSAQVAQGYNRLKIPVVVFSSLVARASEGRLGWHDGNAFIEPDLHAASAETKLTEAGVEIFGGSIYERVDWHEPSGGVFKLCGRGSVGSGSVLAKLNESILVAHWDVGDAPGNPNVAGVNVFPGERLLFNLDNNGEGGLDDFACLTPEGKAALTMALSILKPAKK